MPLKYIWEFRQQSTNWNNLQRQNKKWGCEMRKSWRNYFCQEMLWRHCAVVALHLSKFDIKQILTKCMVGARRAAVPPPPPPTNTFSTVRSRSGADNKCCDQWLVSPESPGASSSLQWRHELCNSIRYWGGGGGGGLWQRLASFSLTLIHCCLYL